MCVLSALQSLLICLLDGLCCTAFTACPAGCLQYCLPCMPCWLLTCTACVVLPPPQILLIRSLYRDVHVLPTLQALLGARLPVLYCLPCMLTVRPVLYRLLCRSC
jgi:hypothetical protein